MPPKKKSNHLTVTFSGFHGRENEGIGATYNYVKPISKIDCHRLFILDDYNREHNSNLELYEGEVFINSDDINNNFDEQLSLNEEIDEQDDIKVIEIKWVATK